ncbi:MAG: hypothetical protein OK456_09880 [Thaumarchaeota archaeon]|nr:hypothetical protein [Nitrososphaerota archaeon]
MRAQRADSGSLLLRAVPIGAYLAVTVLVVALALTSPSRLIVAAPLASSLVFVFGLATSDPDVIFLGWLDQGSNLALIETEVAGASILLVATSVIAVLLLGDVFYSAMSFSPYGGLQGVRQLRRVLPRFLLVGGAATLLTLAGIALVPSISLTSDPELVVAVLAVAALASIVVLGSTDR